MAFFLVRLDSARIFLGFGSTKIRLDSAQLFYGSAFAASASAYRSKTWHSLSRAKDAPLEVIKFGVDPILDVDSRSFVLLP